MERGVRRHTPGVGPQLKLMVGWDDRGYTQREEVGSEWSFHLYHVGGVEGAEPTGVSKHRYVARGGGLPCAGGDTTKGLCPQPCCFLVCSLSLFL